MKAARVLSAPVLRATVLSAALLCTAVACSSETASDEGAGSTPAATSESTTPTSEVAPQEASGTVIDLVIQGESISPTNERLDATVGEPITIRVDSDTADELHVHSVPDHTFEVQAEPGQSFEFTVDVPGQVAIELHNADRTVATVAVRP